METPNSFVSKARTAIHSAAARAERVFVDFKSDRDSDNLCSRNGNPNQEARLKSHHEAGQSRSRTRHLGSKLEWQEKFKNVRIRMKGFGDSEKADDSTISAPVYVDSTCIKNMAIYPEAKAFQASSPVEVLENTMYLIPPALIAKQLAGAIKDGGKFTSVKDLLASHGTSSAIRDRTDFSFSSVKLLVRNDKEVLNSLVADEGDFLASTIGDDSVACTVMASLPKDIHGAPPQSFITRLAEVTGRFKDLQKMVLFWSKVVSDIKSFWSEGKHIPGIPSDEVPDLDSCLLYQQLQVINCCISRKRRHAAATELLDSVIKEVRSNEESAISSRLCANSPLYARLWTGEYCLRRGADHMVHNLTLLETGEAMYSPVTQEGPLLTEDLIKETEELVLRTGSNGAGCCQLLSDMQAFKAANPGCILEDFVRWHSPLDWTESALSDQDESSSVTRGQLSCRMQKQGNLWHELWETAKPVPAVNQTPIFDEDLAVEGILDSLEDIAPSKLFEQLFISLLGMAFVMAEASVSKSDYLLKLFNECKHYVVTTCQSSDWRNKIDDLCQVYETMEAIVISPEQVLKAQEQTTDKTASEKQTTVGEVKQTLMKIPLFGIKDRQSRWRNSEWKDQKNSNENHAHQPFSSFFDKKSYFFSKKSLTSKNTWQTNRTSHEPELLIV